MSLLCCPFCGGEPKKEEQMDEDIWSHNTVPWRRVGCNQCEIWTNWTCEDFDPSETEAWNRRPALATPSPGKADAERFAFLIDRGLELIACEREVGPPRMWTLGGLSQSIGWFPTQRAAIDAAIKSDKQ